MSHWQTVYTSSNPHRAEIVKDILNNAQIPATVVNLKDSSYQLGRLEVRVSSEMVLNAIKIITEEISFDE